MSSQSRRGGALFVLAPLAAAGVIAAACSGSGSSTGTSTAPGDNVTNDTRDAETRAPANPDPGDGSEPLGQPDATYGEGGVSYDDGATATAYPGISECSSCSCPATTSYCFGGATPRAMQVVGSKSVPEANGDAGPPCPTVAAGALGCNALPAGTTDCASLVATLQASYSCYLVCAYDGKQMTVYCPSP